MSILKQYMKNTTGGVSCEQVASVNTEYSNEIGSMLDKVDTGSKSLLEYTNGSKGNRCTMVTKRQAVMQNLGIEAVDIGMEDYQISTEAGDGFFKKIWDTIKDIFKAIYKKMVSWWKAIKKFIKDLLTTDEKDLAKKEKELDVSKDDYDFLETIIMTCDQKGEEDSEVNDWLDVIKKEAEDMKVKTDKFDSNKYDNTTLFGSIYQTMAENGGVELSSPLQKAKYINGRVSAIADHWYEIIKQHKWSAVYKKEFVNTNMVNKSVETLSFVVKNWIQGNIKDITVNYDEALTGVVDETDGVKKFAKVNESLNPLDRESGVQEYYIPTVDDKDKENISHAEVLGIPSVSLGTIDGSNIVEVIKNAPGVYLRRPKCDLFNSVSKPVYDFYVNKVDNVLDTIAKSNDSILDLIRNIEKDLEPVLTDEQIKWLPRTTTYVSKAYNIVYKQIIDMLSDISSFNHKMASVTMDFYDIIAMFNGPEGNKDRKRIYESIYKSVKRMGKYHDVITKRK